MNLLVLAANGGGDLPSAGPDTGKPLAALTRDAEGSERPYERCLNLPEIPVQVLRVTLEVDDGIADELPRTMEGHVATPLHLVQFHAPCREERW